MSPRLRALLLMMLTAVVATPALADFKRDYGNAMKSIKGEDWAKAVSELESAIGENPDSAERVRLYGMRFDVYMPHYFLGEARFRMGDCQGAVQAWTEALNRGVIQTQPEFGAMQTNMNSCSGATAVDVSSIAAAAREAINGLKSSADRLAGLESDPMMGSTWSRFASDLNSARQRLSSLGQRLTRAESDKDADAIEAIQREASSAVDAVNNLITQAESALEDNRVAANRARQDLVRALASARNPDDKGSRDPKVQSVKQELVQLVNRGEALGSNASVDQYTSLARSLRNKEREFTVALQEWEAAQAQQQQAVARRTPPAELKRVAEAYFAGQYDDAVRMADPANFQDARAQIQAHLFRAAARYNLYTLQGAEDRRMLQQVQNDIRSIKRLDNSFSPYLAAFPPKFMTLFENT